MIYSPKELRLAVKLANRRLTPRVTAAYRVDLLQHDGLSTLVLLNHQEHGVRAEVPREPVVHVGAISTLHYRVLHFGESASEFFIHVRLTRRGYCPLPVYETALAIQDTLGHDDRDDARLGEVLVGDLSAVDDDHGGGSDDVRGLICCRMGLDCSGVTRGR